MRSKYGIQGYPNFNNKRGTRGKGRRINHKSSPRNLGKLIEEAIAHLSTHNCGECTELISDFKTNLLSPFGVRCYECEEPISDRMLRVSNEGRTYCQKCSTPV